jgi:hypothetical protein
MFFAIHDRKQFTLKPLESSLHVSIGYRHNWRIENEPQPISLMAVLFYRPTKKDVKALMDLGLIQEPGGVLALELEINHTEWQPKKKSIVAIGNLPVDVHLNDLPQQTLSKKICTHSTLWLSQRATLTQLAFGQFDKGLLDFQFSGFVLDREGEIAFHAREQLPVKVIVCNEDAGTRTEKPLVRTEYLRDVKAFLFSRFAIRSDNLSQIALNKQSRTVTARWISS